jgi:2-amino-4-hydroxy-6-hydroxymethyldihydropteridine diphosphokinase
VSRKRAVVYIGFGSNVGDRQQNVFNALLELQKSPFVSIQKVSSFYETDPVGYTEQADFINGVVEIATDLSPAQLLSFVQGIEQKLGRTRTVRWGPRMIDLDILLYDETVLKSDELVIPHREMHKRRFVLGPLAEIAPDIMIPGTEKTVSQLLNDTTDSSRIQPVKTSADVEQKVKEV